MEGTVGNHTNALPNFPLSSASRWLEVLQEGPHFCSVVRWASTPQPGGYAPFKISVTTPLTIVLE